MESKTILMQQMSNLDYFFLSRELNRELAGGRFNKAYQTGERRLRFKFHKQGERNLAVELGVRAHLTKFVEEAASEQSVFVSLLRKKLDNAVVEEVSQQNFDRVIRFKLCKKEAFFLFLEMLGKGNAVLTGANSKIIGVFEGQEYAARSLKPGHEYVLPPSNKILPGEATESDFSDCKGKVVAVLSKKVALSPFYLKEACARAGVDAGAQFEELPREKVARLLQALHSLLGECKPVVYFKDGNPFAFSPFPLVKFAGDATFSFKEFKSFSDALDEYYAAARAREPEKAKPIRLLKLESALAQQQKAVSELEKREAEERAKAELVSLHAETLDHAIALANKLKKGKKTAREIEAAVNEVLAACGLRCSMRKHDELVVEEK
ncbi:MAG: NFACT family protein [Candidatus Micrarchaeia archaeon]